MFFLCYVVLRYDVETNIWNKNISLEKPCPTCVFFWGDVQHCSTAQLTKHMTLTNKNIGKIQSSQNCLSSGIGQICGNWQKSQQQGTKHTQSGPKNRKQPSRPMKQSI